MVGNNNRGEKFILFLINPFISAITSIKDIRDGVSHWFLYVWFLVFGVAFCAVSEAADSFRYVEDFLVEYIHGQNKITCTGGIVYESLYN